MRRLALTLAAVAACGCSTAPVTNLLDRVHPSRPTAPEGIGEATPPPPRLGDPGVYPPERGARRLAGRGAGDAGKGGDSGNGAGKGGSGFVGDF